MMICLWTILDSVIVCISFVCPFCCDFLVSWNFSYPNELDAKDTTHTQNSVSFLDLQINNGWQLKITVMISLFQNSTFLSSFFYNKNKNCIIGEIFSQLQRGIAKVDQEENHIFEVDLKCTVVSEKIKDIWSDDGHQVMIKGSNDPFESAFSYYSYYVGSNGTTKWSNGKIMTQR